MRIEAVDFFYLAMPEITDEADGSQDALLVRVAAGGQIGWGECEAAPLPSIAAFVCPKSHGVCRPVGDSVLGKSLHDPADIARMSAEVAYNSMDLLQAAAHLVGRRDGAVGPARPRARRAGVEDARLPEQLAEDALCVGPVRRHARRKRSRVRAGCRARNFRAAKFGWGPIGRGSAGAGRGALRRRARGPRQGRHPAGRHRPDLHRRRRARRAAAAGARGGARDLVRGAFRRERARRPMAALAAAQHAR